MSSEEVFIRDSALVTAILGLARLQTDRTKALQLRFDFALWIHGQQYILAVRCTYNLMPRAAMRRALAV